MLIHYSSKLLLEIFQICDEGNKNFLTLQDLKVAWIHLFGYKPSSLEVKRFLRSEHEKSYEHKKSDEHDEVQLSFPTFEKLIGNRLKSLFDHCEIRQLFYAFDVRCRGFLTLDDVIRAFKSVAPGIQQSTVATVFNDACLSCHGKLSYRDFEAVMTRNSNLIQYNQL